MTWSHRMRSSVCLFTLLALVAVLVPLGALPAAGSLTLGEQKLWVAGGAEDDLFGNAVAMTSDTLVVGAYGEGTWGSVYVYRRSGDTWGLEQELQPEDSPWGGGFGLSVAISGDTIAVGTPYDASLAGAVYVFTRSGTTWTQQHKITAGDGAASDFFGLAVAIDGDTVLCGAPGDEDRTGSAYVFTRSGTVWSPQQKITSGGATGDEFGYALALDGDTAIVGAPFLDVGANTYVGAAYVFTRSGSTWTQGPTLSPTAAGPYQYFGNAVALDNGTAVIGGLGTSAAYVFTEDAGVWSQEQKLTGSDGTGSYFSNAVAVSGDTVIVGSPNHTHEAVPSGSAYIYTRTDGVWTEQAELLASDRVAEDRYGWAVACTTTRFAVGALWADPVASKSGAVYVYQPSNTAPVAVNDAYSTPQDTPLVISIAQGVLDNDYDPDGDTLSANPVTQPSHGDLVLEEDGSFTYTPDAGFIGVDSFTYEANDGTDVSNTATVTITVTDALADGCFRIAGDNRYLTSVAASLRGFPSGAKTVVVAKGTDWPDALGGSALAGAVGGPLLLTRPDALPSEVAAEIKRLGATKAYVLGSTASISAGVAAAIDALPLVTEVERLGGANRYETARKVADETISLLGPDYKGEAFVATGLNFPDATGAAPVAAALGRPILLANVTAGTVYVPAKTAKVVILGSVAAVPATIETYLNGRLGDANVGRLSGKNRYDTAAMAAQLGVNAGMRWDGVGLATGVNFPDALSGGAMLGELNSVLLLTRPDVLSGEAKTKLWNNKAAIDTLFIFGDKNAVSAAVETAAKAAAL